MLLSSAASEQDQFKQIKHELLVDKHIRDYIFAENGAKLSL